MTWPIDGGVAAPRPEPGLAIGLAGPTGSGKTHLLRRSFRAWRQVHAGPSAAAFLGQNPANQVFADTVEQEVGFALEARDLPQPEIAARVQAALARLNMAGVRQQPTGYLSMGEKCRAVLAALDAIEASAIFLDEPFAQLDAEGAARLRALVGDWTAEGRAVVVTAQTAADLAFCAHVDTIPASPLRAQPGAPDGIACVQAGNGRVIEARGLAVEGARERRILDGLSLCVDPGDFIAIHGNNGAGKTTLLRALVEDIAPHEGRIEVLGRPPRPGRLSGRVGYVPQDPDLMLSGASTGMELARLVARRHGGESETAALLAFGGLRHERSSLQLSHGEKQILGLLLGLAVRPDLLLLDEALCGVASGTATRIADGLRQLCARSGLAILAVSHDPGSPLVMRSARRLRLEEGRLHAA